MLYEILSAPGRRAKMDGGKYALALWDPSLTTWQWKLWLVISFFLAFWATAVFVG